MPERYSMAPIMFCLVGIPLLYLLTRDTKMRAKVLADALVTKEVQVFGGPENPIVRDPGTGLAISELPTQFIVADVVEVAELPETYTFSADLPLPTVEDIQSGERIPQREMTPEELAELKAMLPRYAVNSLGWRIAILIYMGSVTISSFVRVAGRDPLLGSLFGVLCLFAFWNIWDSFKQQRKLKKDLETGIVLRLQTDGQRVEWLPTSRLMWTVDQQPTAGRKHGRFRRL